jgi:gluconolactonase
VHHNATTLASEDLPCLLDSRRSHFSYVKDNLAVIPGEWEAGDISQLYLKTSSLELKLMYMIETPFYDIQSDQSHVQDALKRIKFTDLIAWDASFFSIIGSDAKLEKIQSFEGQPPRMHEAPVFVPETNELFFC